MTDKVIRDGKVAVIISRGFGAGWSTWNNSDAETAAWCRHDPGLVAAVEAGDIDKFRALAEAKDADLYIGGVDKDDLDIVWVAEGTPYYIHEYDGSERVVTTFPIA